MLRQRRRGFLKETSRLLQRFRGFPVDRARDLREHQALVGKRQPVERLGNVHVGGEAEGRRVHDGCRLRDTPKAGQVLMRLVDEVAGNRRDFLAAVLENGREQRALTDDGIHADAVKHSGSEFRNRATFLGTTVVWKGRWSKRRTFVHIS